jgi:hypothetical protein
LGPTTSIQTGCDSKESFGHSQVLFYLACVTRIIRSEDPLLVAFVAPSFLQRYAFHPDAKPRCLGKCGHPGLGV